MISFYKKRLFPLIPCSAGDRLHKTPCPNLSIHLHLFHCTMLSSALLHYFDVTLSIYDCSSIYVILGQPNDSFMFPEDLPQVVIIDK